MSRTEKRIFDVEEHRVCLRQAYNACGYGLTEVLPEDEWPEGNWDFDEDHYEYNSEYESMIHALIAKGWKLV